MAFYSLSLLSIPPLFVLNIYTCSCSLKLSAPLLCMFFVHLGISSLHLYYTSVPSNADSFSNKSCLAKAAKEARAERVVNLPQLRKRHSHDQTAPGLQVCGACSFISKCVCVLLFGLSRKVQGRKRIAHAQLC